MELNVYKEYYLLKASKNSLIYTFFVNFCSSLFFAFLPNTKRLILFSEVLPSKLLVAYKPEKEKKITF
jgi:hypothetical protein